MAQNLLQDQLFRPCIDLHGGKVKQIVGATLVDSASSSSSAAVAGSASTADENFVSELPSTHYASLYRSDGLRGGHVIKLGGGNEEAALAALRAYPGGLQIGGGVTPANAMTYLDAGASHVIVTSYVFRAGVIDWARLDELVAVVGKERLVLDLSCRRKRPSGAVSPASATAAGGGGDDDASARPYYVVTDRWQTYTNVTVDAATLSKLSAYCAEFLVHGVDVEGTRTGIDDDLVRLLGEHSPLPVTYAGGARGLDDMERVRRLGRGRVGLTIGSALDIFGGECSYAEIVAWDRARARGTLPSNNGKSGLVSMRAAVICIGAAGLAMWAVRRWWCERRNDDGDGEGGSGDTVQKEV